MMLCSAETADSVAPPLDRRLPTSAGRTQFVHPGRSYLSLVCGSVIAEDRAGNTNKRKRHIERNGRDGKGACAMCAAAEASGALSASGRLLTAMDDIAVDRAVPRHYRGFMHFPCGDAAVAAAFVDGRQDVARARSKSLASDVVQPLLKALLPPVTADGGSRLGVTAGLGAANGAAAVRVGGAGAGASALWLSSPTPTRPPTASTSASVPPPAGARHGASVPVLLSESTSAQPTVVTVPLASAVPSRQAATLPGSISHIATVSGVSLGVLGVTAVPLPSPSTAAAAPSVAGGDAGPSSVAVALPAWVQSAVPVTRPGLSDGTTDVLPSPAVIDAGGRSVVPVVPVPPTAVGVPLAVPLSQRRRDAGVVPVSSAELPAAASAPQASRVTGMASADGSTVSGGEPPRQPRQEQQQQHGVGSVTSPARVAPSQSLWMATSLHPVAPTTTPPIGAVPGPPCATSEWYKCDSA
jgi:hypothetical protein